MQNDLGFSDFQAGLLNTALIVAAVLLAVPGGLLADRLDRRKLMAGVLVLWSLSTVLAGLSQRYWQVFTMRAALGAGDAINDPAAQSLVADYYPVAVRGRAYAFQRVIPTVGLGLGTVLGGVLLGFFGWRIAVVAVAAPGILVALLVRRLPLPPAGRGRRCDRDPRGGADDLGLHQGGRAASRRVRVAARRPRPSSTAS